MFPINAFRATLTRVIAILKAHAIRFHLTGGITSIAYGEPRLTQDIDLVVDQPAIKIHLASLLDSLKTSGFLFDESTVHDAIEQKQMFQLFDSEESLKLDLYPRELIPGELQRSVMLELFEDFHVPIASLSDTATAKLIWASKGSHKSRRDLRQLVRVASDAEQQTIQRQATELDLHRLLNDILAESDEIDA